MSVWDDPEMRTGGDFIKFDNPGDKISGTVTAVRTHRFDDGGVVPQILLTLDNGEERTLTAGQIRLKAALSEQRPEAGDHLAVVHTHVEKRTGGKTLKHFEVTVTRAGATAPVAATQAAAAAPTAVDDVPPGVDPTVFRALPADKQAQIRALTAA